jgi:two-component system, response regulator PdtaR
MTGSRSPFSSLVLVVEDEDLVRMMASDMLEDAGFTVIEAAYADEAGDILESRADIGVRFTDIEMPGSMSGFAFAAQVAERWPHIRLVITSGRCRPAPRDVPDHGMFVPKPYLVEQVLSARHSCAIKFSAMRSYYT